MPAVSQGNAHEDRRLTAMSHKNPIGTEMARMLVGDESAVAGQGRIVLCGHPPVKGVARTLIGGWILADLSTNHDNQWEMMEGSFIFVPRRRFADYVFSGSCLDDIICDSEGMLPKNWKEIR